MKKILLFGIIILILFISSCTPQEGDFGYSNTSKELCEEAGGEYIIFNDGCGDSCDLLTEDITCTQSETYNCDCGSDLCWNEGRCEKNP